MYLLYAGPNSNKSSFLENVLYSIDKSKTLLSVNDGYQLLHFLQKVKQGEAYPALIILEMDMPRLNGKETLELLRTDDIYRLIPVVILAAKAEPAEINFFHKMGADYLQQPYTNANWKITVKELCDRCAND